MAYVADCTLSALRKCFPDMGHLLYSGQYTLKELGKWSNWFDVNKDIVRKMEVGEINEYSMGSKPELLAGQEREEDNSHS